MTESVGSVVQLCMKELRDGGLWEYCSAKMLKLAGIQCKWCAIGLIWSIFLAQLMSLAAVPRAVWRRFTADITKVVMTNSDISFFFLFFFLLISDISISAISDTDINSYQVIPMCIGVELTQYG